MGAYEALWLRKGATFKSIAERFAADKDALPSDFVPPSESEECTSEVLQTFDAAGVGRFGVRIHHAGDYPQKLRDAKHPVELLYFRGIWDVAETRCVAVVGSRKPSEEGVQRARMISRELVQHGFTVVSGLATGIDTAAHTAALEAGGLTVGVIGTPIHTSYPRENRQLQDEIARNYLLISQVPVLRYLRQKPPQNRLFFPERNATMSALTEATIIVEAGETSGTLTQARAALYQGRKLMILDSCFNRPELTWPARFVEQGAIRIKTLDDIWHALDQNAASTAN
ncbi:DNA-processing protein DprA [Methyloceanibacter caenitepidi]